VTGLEIQLLLVVSNRRCRVLHLNSHRYNLIRDAVRAQVQAAVVGMFGAGHFSEKNARTFLYRKSVRYGLGK
jgi:hypothetical protein